MGNQNQNQEIEKDKKPKIDTNMYVLWLDKNVNSDENKKYQAMIKNMKIFEFLTYTSIKDCLSKLKEINFRKTYLIISGSISKAFFIEFEKVINIINVCPEIIVFTSKNIFSSIKNNIINLDNFSLFDINLVFKTFPPIETQLKSFDKYKPHYIEPDKLEELKENDCFSFEYINSSNDLILPLTFMEFMEIPNKFEIISFNEFLLDKFSNKIEMKELIEQLLLDTKIPLQILVKYWIRTYTLETKFYGEMNSLLEKKLSDEYDIYIRMLYYGLKKHILEPCINKELYRGALIKKKEIDYIQDSLKNKKENLPGCICYNKAFLSSSLDKEIALKFLGKKNPKKNESRVLYIFSKGKDLDKENATNASIEDLSRYEEKEILFFPYSCFEITKIKESQEKTNNENYFEVYLSYLGEYKSIINKMNKIPENNFAKDILSSGALDKIEMNKEENKNKFDFKIDKYIPKEYMQSYIFATYDITSNDINKNIQIINCDANINKDEILHKCNIYLDDKKIDFTFEYNFKQPGKYIFTFEFVELLQYANKLFYKCSTLCNLDFRKFKTNCLKDMSDIFNGCNKLETLDLSSFKTKDVISMKASFKDCSSLKALDLSTFDTKKVNDMSEMFKDCSSLTILNVSNFDTQNVKSMCKMFYGCKSLFFINISKFILNEDIKSENMFYDCPYFNNLKNEFISEITDYDISIFFLKAFNNHLLDESLIMSNSIKTYLKNKKYENIEILNQSMEELKNNNLKNINIFLVGENEEIKNNLITKITSNNKFDFLNLFNIEDVNNIEKEIKDLKNFIDFEKDKNMDINFIWICNESSSINDYLKNALNILNDKYMDKIPIFILFLNSQENNNFEQFQKDLINSFQNKNIEIFQTSLEDIDSFDKIMLKTKNISTKLNLIDIVNKKLEQIEIENNLNDLPNTMSKYFEKLLGEYEDINKYISGHLKNLLVFSKNKLNTDTVNNFIDRFKKEKLKLKMKISKKIDVEKFNDELNKEIGDRYIKISQEFYNNKYDEEVFNFFKTFLKNEAKKIIEQTIKDLKPEDLKAFN